MDYDKGSIQSIKQLIGRIDRRSRGTDIFIVDHVSLLGKSQDVTDSAQLMMRMMQRKMKIYNRLTNRKRKITNLYETDKPNNVEIEENWGFY